MPELRINESNFREFITEPTVDGKRMARGLVRRDLRANPIGVYGSSVPWSTAVETIPREEWPERCAEMAATKTRLSDIHLVSGEGGRHIESLDQNGQGFCWAYSSVMALMMLRALANLPYKRLSPHAVACKIFGFQDRGAWGALSMDFLAATGVPEEKFWPQKSMSRHYDTAETWANANQHRVTEGWMDISVEAYDRVLTFDQVATAMLTRFPVVCDFNWWGHSVCGLDLVDLRPDLNQRGLFDPNRWGTRIKNSWSDSWGELGVAVLEGDKGVPDGACCPRVPTAG